MKIHVYDDKAHRKQVVGLWEAVFGYEAGHNRPGLVIDKKLALNDDLFVVARSRGRVIGTVMAGYDGHRGWIYTLAVHPDYQRQGVGSALLSHAEMRLADLGCLKINLQILEENRSVQEFYMANGFSSEKRISMGKTVK